MNNTSRDINEHLTKLYTRYSQQPSYHEDVINTILDLRSIFSKRPLISPKKLYHALPNNQHIYSNQYHTLSINPKGQLMIIAPNNNSKSISPRLKYITPDIVEHMIELLYPPPSLAINSKSIVNYLDSPNYNPIPLIERIHRHCNQLTQQHIIFTKTDTRSVVGSYLISNNPPYIDKIIGENKDKGLTTTIYLNNKQEWIIPTNCYYLSKHRLKQYLQQDHTKQ